MMYTVVVLTTTDLFLYLQSEAGRQIFATLLRVESLIYTYGDPQRRNSPIQLLLFRGLTNVNISTLFLVL